MNKKKILTIILVLIVVLLGGASYYIATQLSNKQAIAPTAPESRPKASETVNEGESCNMTTSPARECATGFNCQSISEVRGADGVCVQEGWTASSNCSVTATAVACTPSDTVTCSPDCPTACGTAASTITTCTNSCGVATTKECVATEACNKATLKGSKTAYKNEVANIPGKYTLTTEIETVAKSQIYVYSIVLTNDSDVNATGVTIKDSLANVPSVTFMDTVSGCSFNATSKELTCNTTVNKDETKTFSFRVKAVDGIINGEIISNTAMVTYDGGDRLELVKDLPISTVVGCNHTCTTDEECSTGLTCDTTTSKCRKSACLSEDDCTCNIVITSTIAPTVTKTTTVTATPTEKVVVEATPTVLPETGIFDLPGIAAFGGGLVLAVVGILLAL